MIGKMNIKINVKILIKNFDLKNKRNIIANTISPSIEPLLCNAQILKQHTKLKIINKNKKNLFKFFL